MAASASMFAACKHLEHAWTQIERKVVIESEIDFVSSQLLLHFVIFCCNALGGGPVLKRVS